MKEFEGINKEEIQKAVERIQAEHPIRFGKAFDVSTFNCSEVSELDGIIETIQKKTTDDVEWNLICQMAIAYINESKGRVEVIKRSPNIPIEYAYPKGCIHSGYYDPTRELLFIGCITTEYAKSIGVEWEVIEEWRPSKNERPQGEWIEDSGNIACSHCHTIWLYRRTDFCPNCGADMRGGRK